MLKSSHEIGRRLQRFHDRMSGRLTPPERLPPLDRPVSWVLPLADLFMALMLSRPPGGSLRTARVTLVTIWLALAVTVLIGIPGLLLAGYGAIRSQWLPLLAGLGATGIGVGSASLIAVGIRQRQLLARNRRR